MTEYSFIPLSATLGSWPEDKFPLPAQLSKIGLKDTSISHAGGLTFDATGTVVTFAEIVVELAFIPGVSLAIANQNGYTEIDFEIEIRGTNFLLCLDDLSAAVRVESGLLKKVELSGSDWVEATDADGNPEPFEVGFSGPRLCVRADGEISFDWGAGAPAFDFPSFTIGETGVVIEVVGVALILSDDEAASLPATIDSASRGVYLDSATLHLPEGLTGILPESLQFDDAFIGSGGFSGSVTADYGAAIDSANPFEVDAGDIFGLQFRLESLNVAFVQNSLVAGGLTGYLKLPFFDDSLYVEIGLTNDGDFTIGVLGTGDGIELSVPGVLTVSVEAIELAKEGDELLVKISGDITPELADVGDWPSFELKGLTVSSTGKVTVEDGWIELPQQKSLDFHGFLIEITQLGFGTEDVGATTYQWIGFSGGIQIVSGVPLQGGVEGLKLLWDPNDPSDVKLQISGISIGFEIAEVLNFSGRVEFIEESDGVTEIKGFGGGVSLTLVPLNGLGVEAQFLAGRDQGAGLNFFYIYMDVSLPLGIPIVPPALGLYGLAGLFGYNTTVDRAPEEEWYGDESGNGFYKRSPEGLTSSQKWTLLEDALALGAGVTLRTLPDAGFSLSTRVLLVLLVPGPVIIFEGRAAIVTRDVSDEDSFPFKILVVMDGEAGTFLANVEASYLFPKEGSKAGFLVDVGGLAEAFFNFNDASDWHLYLGQDEPESKRVHADILSFFKASTYLMLDPSQLRFGLWIGYDFQEKYGPLKVVLQAWIEGRLTLGFEPIQADGSVTLYGNAELKAFGVGLGLSVEANVGVEAPKPLVVEASVQVQLKTPLGNPKATVKLKWEKTGDPGYPLVLEAAGSSHGKVTENRALTLASGYDVDDDGIWEGTGGEDSAVDWGSVPEVPPDTRIVLNFAKPVRDGPGFATPSNGTPAEESIGSYYYKYSLVSVELEEAEGSAGPWTDVSDRLFGSWQVVQGGEDLQNTQLLIGATTPFEWSEVLQDNQSWLGFFLLSNPEYPCGPAYVPAEVCIDFERWNLGQVPSPFLFEDGFVVYSPAPITVVYCDPRDVKAIETSAAEPLEFCADFEEIAPGSYSAPIALDAVQVAPGSHGPIEVEDTMHGRAADVGNSSDGAGAVPVKILFPALPSSPREVRIRFFFPDNSTATFTAYGALGNALDDATVVDDGSHAVHTVVLRGDGIAYVEITGVLVHLLEICWRFDLGAAQPEIKVTLPESSHQVSLRFCPGAAGTIEALDVANVQRALVDIAAEIDSAHVVTLRLPRATARAVVVRGDFKLRQVCYLPTSELSLAYDSEQTRILNEEVLEDIWDKTSADIFAPDKHYRMRVVTSAERRKKSSSTWEAAVEYAEWVHFKTGGPPGTTTVAAPTTDTESQPSYPAGGPLANADSYVLRSIPESSGASDARVRAYRSYDVGVEYNESYVEQMYLSGGFHLRIRLFDNNGEQVRDATGAPADIVNLWALNSRRVLTQSQTIFKDIFESADCIAFGTSEPTDSEIDLSDVTPLLLRPGVQYRAQLTAVNGARAYPVHSFSFLTSAWVSFVHHLHSYAHAAWDHFALQDDATYTVDDADLDTVLGSTLPESMRFEQLMSVFGMPVSRPLPAAVEITALSDLDEIYGLLIETPEPFDWDRATLGLSRVDFAEPLEVHEGDFRLAAAAVNARSDPNEQYVDVLLRAGGDLSGYRLEHRAWIETEDDVEILHTFADGSEHEEGALVRVFLGSEPASPAQTEHVSLYAGLADAPFDHERHLIRLRDAAGEVVHERIFLRPTLYTDFTVDTVANGDGTRVFVFVDGGGAWSSLADGLYRLELTFARDIGDAGPLLLRRGHDDDEIAVLEFSLPARLPDV